MKQPTTYLFFDTETTGLPARYDARWEELDNWPRIVQLAWMLTDAEGKPLSEREDIVAPVDFTIPAAAQQVHGISTQEAQRVGRPSRLVMFRFREVAARASALVAHNMSYDRPIVMAEILRLGTLPSWLANKPVICTKECSTDYCRLPNRSHYGGYKWPSLKELHRHLFDQDVEGAHQAATDVQATVRCFFELQRRGVSLSPSWQ